MSANDPSIPDDEQLDRELAELDENPSAPVDETVRGLRSELETLAQWVRQPIPSLPHESEPACSRAVEAAQSLARQSASHPEAERLDLPAGSTVGPYQIISKRGQGGMGAVFVAHDPDLDRRVALKVMLPKVAAQPGARQRFSREARLAARLKSDHIVHIYQVGEDKGMPYLAMQLLDGSPLDQLLQSGRKLGLRHIVRIGCQIAHGLADAHAQGLIHRDIKPSNVWLEPAATDSEDDNAGLETLGRVKLLDFGLARLEGDGTRLTQPGTVLGTPAYMAPEQARGEAVDARADLWSLGVILYQMTTGRRPFTGTSTMAVLMSIGVDQPVPPDQLNPELPPVLAELIMRLLEKDRQQRPASARQVAAELAELEKTIAADSQTASSSVDLLAPTELFSPGRSDSDLAALLDSPQTAQVAPSDGARSKATAARTVIVPASQTAASPAAAAQRHRGRWLLTALAALLLIVGPMAWLFGGTLIRFATNQGEVVIETEDPNIEVIIKDQSGTIIDKGSQRRYTVRAGTRHQLEVAVKDEQGEVIKFATRNFTVRRGGREVLRVALEQAKTKAAPSAVVGESRDAGDPDRRAAEWVLSIGGTVRINGQKGNIGTASGLPSKPFRLTDVELLGNPKVSDAGLAHLKGLRNLVVLNLESTQVSDAGLEQLQGLTNLVYLELKDTRVSDAGLAHLKGLTNLRYLLLAYTQVSGPGLKHLKGLRISWLDLRGWRVNDASLEYLKELPKLPHLILRRTRVSDAGLAHLQGLKNLRQLDLRYNQVGDAGLEHLQGLTNLTHLDLDGTLVSDAGLVHLQGLNDLTALVLKYTQISDAGLKNLKGLTNLTELDLSSTRVSDAGLEFLVPLPRLGSLRIENCRVSRKGYEQLKAAMPKTTIYWSEPNRTAAEHVLALGGTVLIAAPAGQPRSLKPGDPLPREFFQLRRLSLTDCQKALDDLTATLAQLRFQQFDRLEAVDLSGTPLQDVGFLSSTDEGQELRRSTAQWDSPHEVSFLYSIHGLKDLTLADSGISDAHLATLPKLRRLVLDGNPIRGPGLQGLANQSELVELSLARVGLSYQDLADLPPLPKLQRLVLDGNPGRGLGLGTVLADQPELIDLSLACPDLIDLGVRSVGRLKRLKRLSLAGSSITDAGLTHLVALTDLKELDLTGTKVTQAGVASLQKALPDCKILWEEAK